VLQLDQNLTKQVVIISSLFYPNLSHHHKAHKALSSLICGDVPLGNCLLTHSGNKGNFLLYECRGQSRCRSPSSFSHKLSGKLTLISTSQRASPPFGQYQSILLGDRGT